MPVVGRQTAGTRDDVSRPKQKGIDMGYTENYLSAVGGDIAADDEALKEARSRLRLVRDIASTFPGALRTYGSGSLEQHTVIAPVNDGDGGLVLNRVNYPGLGPEGRCEPPTEVTSALCALLGPTIRAV